MAYSTLDDLKKRISEEELIQLTDDDGLGAVDEDVVADATADADEEIDGYIGLRNQLPLTTVPGFLKKLSTDITIFNLYARRPGTMPDERKERYDNAVRILMRVAEGKLSLGQSDPEGNPAVKAGIDYEAEDEVMTSTKLARF